jgi:hypothetical protein
MRPNLRAVTNLSSAFLFGTIGATKDLSALLDAMTDDSATAMRAGRRHRVNSAFEAVESHSPAVLHNPESSIILITAMITFSHRGFSSSVQQYPKFFPSGQIMVAQQSPTPNSRR